jgi:membrane associated rhomboid family serine protease
VFEKILKACRNLVFPLLLGVAYTVQTHMPALFKQCALWSDYPRWWQFFANGFLSGNWIHLAFNMCGIWVVCAQFASRIRLYFLLIYFVLFSAVSSFLYFRFFMPPHAWLVGASGGVYALIGFLCWFQRRDRICFLGIRKLAMPFLPAMLLLLIIEFLIATFWIPVLAWQLHIIAFSISIFTAMAIHAVYAALHRLVGLETFVFKGILKLGILFLRQAKYAVIKVPIKADS